MRRGSSPGSIAAFSDRHARERGHPEATDTDIARAILDARFRGRDDWFIDWTTVN
jgi:hypothetical protein